MKTLESLSDLPVVEDVTLQRMSGWWDSIQIAADGTRLLLAYNRYTIWSFLAVTPLVASGGYPGHMGNALGTSPWKDMCLYDCVLTEVAGTPARIVPLSFNTPDEAYSSGHYFGAVGARKLYYVCQRGEGTVNSLKARTETAENVWGAESAEFATLNAWAVTNAKYLDNPCPNPADDRLFIGVSPGVTSTAKEIWVSQKSGGVWQVPTSLVAVVGTDCDQPFLAPNGSDFYYTRGGVIHHATWNGSALSSDGAVTFAGVAIPGNPGEFTVVTGGTRCYLLRFDPATKKPYLITATNAGTPKTWNEQALVETMLAP